MLFDRMTHCLLQPLFTKAGERPFLLLFAPCPGQTLLSLLSCHLPCSQLRCPPGTWPWFCSHLEIWTQSRNWLYNTPRKPPRASLLSPDPRSCPLLPCPGGFLGCLFFKSLPRSFLVPELSKSIPPRSLFLLLDLPCSHPHHSLSPKPTPRPGLRAQRWDILRPPPQGSLRLPAPRSLEVDCCSRPLCLRQPSLRLHLLFPVPRSLFCSNRGDRTWMCC